MASEAFTLTLSGHLDRLMEEHHLKLEYVATSASVGVETVRRVRNGEVTKLWNRTARKLADFIQRESGGEIRLDLMDKEARRGAEADIFRRMVERSVDGIYLIQDKKIVYSNTRIETMTGYSSEELSASVYTRFLDGESKRQELDRKTSRRQGIALPDRYEVWVIKKDGRKFRAETHIARLSLDGKKTAFGTIRELTE